ncbi:isoprenylcysteine carboxylmethyltransferase family protein [Agaribacterium sp. ZY112]|uniref:methyltransferase family protein n=1 Tax=Agaribacterium sp. ZY112 TaxID=3233574 RepID=UPI003526BAD2
MRNPIPPFLLCLALTPLSYIFNGSFLAISEKAAKISALLLGSLAISLMLIAKYQFSKAHTTINPLRPENSRCLVTHGVFSFSRNPMYLGMALLLVASAIFFRSVLGFGIALAFVIYIDLFQIRAEERALKERFYEAFRGYQRSVRRWL